RIALIAGLLFALHPVHVEVVVGIVGRSELLCSAFFLGALQLVGRPLSRAQSLGAIVCLIGAIASKEQGIVLIPVAIIVRALIARHERVEPEHPRAIATFALAAGFLACYVIAREQFFGLKFVWEKAFLDSRIQPLATISDEVTRIFAPLSLIGRALGYLFFPLNLNIDYANYISAKTDFNTIWPWLGILAIALWLVLFTRSIRQKDHTTTTCLLAFGITYGLVSNIVMLIGTAFGERLLYLPSVFFIIIVSSWLVRLPARAMTITVSVILIGFTVRSVTYASLWDDRLKLYSSLVRQWPENARLRMLYGFELFERGETARGIDECLRAVDVDPTYNRALLRAAQLLVKVDRFDEAEPLLARLDAVAPGSSRSVRDEIKMRRSRLTLTTNPTTRPLDEQPAGE
ncbi:MAG TPA: hypothetical protein PK402_04860, partial [Tepidisphaeraceae bacterium]|nr:hypothetical protein [Tepidisphaeraceae bacterium]